MCFVSCWHVLGDWELECKRVQHLRRGDVWGDVEYCDTTDRNQCSGDDIWEYFRDDGPVHIVSVFRDRSDEGLHFHNDGGIKL